MCSSRIVVPGDLISPLDVNKKSGPSTYCCSGNILSSAFGYVKEESHTDGSVCLSINSLLMLENIFSCAVENFWHSSLHRVNCVGQSKLVKRAFNDFFVCNAY